MAETTLGMPCERFSEDQQKQLTQLLNDYSDVFALCDSELGCIYTDYSIDTGDEQPIPFEHWLWIMRPLICSRGRSVKILVLRRSILPVTIHTYLNNYGESMIAMWD